MLTILTLYNQKNIYEKKATTIQLIEINDESQHIVELTRKAPKFQQCVVAHRMPDQ